MTCSDHPETQPVFITRRNLALRWDTSVSSIIRKERAGHLTPRRQIAGAVRYALTEVRALEADSTQ